MTHNELMAIPEWPTQFGQREIDRDGQRVIVPVAPPMAAMFSPTYYTDHLGHQWAVGSVKGIVYRKLHRSNWAAALKEN